MPAKRLPSLLWHALVPLAVLAPLAAAATLARGALPALSASPQDAGAREAEIVRTLKDQADRAPVALIHELGALRSRAAVEGLLAAYDVLQTTFMKREVVRALPQLDGVADAEQPALQKLLDVATGANEPELREAALDGLGACAAHGRDYLRRIVESPAEDGVREKAITLHVKMARPEDGAWYRALYAEKDDPKAEKDAKKPAKKPAKKEEAPAPAAQPKRGPPLNTIRLAAFGAIAGQMTIDELMTAIGDPYHKIRIAALEELAARGDKSTEGFARARFEDTSEDPTVRVLAARILAKIVGVKAAPDFEKYATRADSTVELRRGLADVLTGFGDPAIDKRLVEGIGKGKSDQEKLFHIWVARSLKDERVDKALVRMLADKDDPIVIAAAKVLGERGYAPAVPVLEKLWKKPGRKRDVMRAALEATSRISSAEPTWIDELVALTKDPEAEVRSLALDALGAAGDARHIDKLVAALDDANWSTRLSALEALERLKSKAAITAIVARMSKEDGRMRNEFANTLWRLTGQPFAESAEAWANWWQGARDSFQVLSDADLERVKTGEEEWRLRQTTRVDSKFFGIRILSHRVIFVIDVSGSMEEGLKNDYRGRPGAKRIEVARAELAKCIQGLDSSAMFNVVPFSSDAERWVDGSLAACNDKNRADAVAYVEALKAGGGTNLFGALQTAFADPDVDTIFVLSDGEPSMGDLIEPVQIREQIQAWNEHRHIVIHTIAIGGQFSILEWLAQDSRGTHVKFE